MASGEYPYVLLNNGYRLLLQSKEMADNVAARLKEMTSDPTIELDAKIEADQPHRHYVLMRTHIVAIVYPPGQGGTAAR